MIFNFKAVLTDKGNGRIDIPINIWEITKKKWVSKARVTIGDKSCLCNIFDEGDGFYSFQYITELRKTFGFNRTVDIQIELRKYMTIIESPYNAENPIRVIDSINYVEQPSLNMCGQACVAMLTGVSADDIHDIMNTWIPIDDMRRSVGYGHICYALDYYGIKHSGKFKTIRDKANPKLPCICIVTLKDQTYGDYVLYYKGTYYDPEYGVGDCCYNGTFKSFLEIF